MSDPNRIPIFQHSPAEHFGISCRKGESISGLGHYDALWIMGGPMDAWQENKHPWLQMEALQNRGKVVRSCVTCLLESCSVWTGVSADIGAIQSVPGCF